MKKKLKDICTGYTKNIAQKDLIENSGEYEIYGASGLVTKIDFFVSVVPYIGIVKDGSGVGRVNSYPAKSSLLGTMQYIIPNEDTDLQFLMYGLRSLKLNELYRGAAIPHIYFKEYKEFFLNVPPKDQQIKIAEHLDKIQAAIDNKKQQLAELDDLVKSKFVEMFGDPVTNKKGWECKKLGELGTFKNGLNFSQVENGTEIKYLGVGDFKNNFSLTNENLGFVISNVNPSEEYFLKNEDIVFVRSNGNKELVGRCVVAYPNSEKVIFSGFCIRFRPKENKQFDVTYLAFALKTESLKAKTVGRGANVQNLNQKILTDLDIPLPPIALQNSFASFVQKIDTAKSVVKAQLVDLQEFLDSMMDKYFGE